MNEEELNTWKVVLQNSSKSLVLYNSSLQQIRTVAQTGATIDVPIPWTSTNYFQILADHFCGAPCLPLSLSDFVTNGYFDRFFPKRTKIGSGGCGSVYRVEHSLAGIKLAIYAVKVIPVGEFTWLQRVINEVRLLEKLSKIPHPLILGYKHCWIEEWQPANFGPKIPCLFILMEFAPLGNVENMISTKIPGIFRKINEDEAWQIFINIIVAVQHLHSLGIIHRDLKLSNVLIFEEKNNHPLPIRLALSDFGTALDTHSIFNIHASRSGATGTVETMAPELFIHDEKGKYLFSHSFASDIWSLGVILFSLFYHINPFFYDNGEQRLQNFTTVDDLIADMKLTTEISPLAMKIIQKTMVLDPKKRCTVEDILNNPKIFEKASELGLNNLLKNDISRPFVISPSDDDLKTSVPVHSPENSHNKKNKFQKITEYFKKEIENGRNDFIINDVDDESSANDYPNISLLLISILILLSAKTGSTFISCIRFIFYITLLVTGRNHFGIPLLIFLLFTSEMALGIVSISIFHLVLLGYTLSFVMSSEMEMMQQLALPALTIS
ncbi:AGC family protein kinase [Tritrichomonas foetus]|uniref:AGC family protein kinase n=1 Tax=Tritrichomonas foetus TaxID=1144522 RepID=A0A1J4JDJ8_9EUKA|nr:AGC family protein kinase [Tritrichomonas foetus]|eukprot:OHS96729.1 AGC family protein kinase [Tritrichomonas foetus]